MLENCILDCKVFFKIVCLTISNTYLEFKAPLHHVQFSATYEWMTKNKGIKNVKLTHNSTPDGKRKILFIGGPTKKTSKFVREFPEEKKSVEFCEKISLAFNQYVLRSIVQM